MNGTAVSWVVASDRAATLSLLAATLAFAPSLASVAGPGYTFAEAGYIVTDIDDFDATGFELGFGYAFPLSETMDLYGKLGYTEVELEVFDDSLDDDGYALSAGLRARVMEQLELEGSVNYVDLSDSGDDTSLGLAARGYFIPQFAVGTEGGFGDDANSYGISARWEFGRP